MNSASGVFLQWGVLQVSLANLIVIVLMVALFVLALVLPFPAGKDASPDAGVRDERR